MLIVEMGRARNNTRANTVAAARTRAAVHVGSLPRLQRERDFEDILGKGRGDGGHRSALDREVEILSESSADLGAALVDGDPRTRAAAATLIAQSLVEETSAEIAVALTEVALVQRTRLIASGELKPVIAALAVRLNHYGWCGDADSAVVAALFQTVDEYGESTRSQLQALIPAAVKTVTEDANRPLSIRLCQAVCQAPGEYPELEQAFVSTWERLGARAMEDMFPALVETKNPPPALAREWARQLTENRRSDDISNIFYLLSERTSAPENALAEVVEAWTRRMKKANVTEVIQTLTALAAAAPAPAPSARGYERLCAAAIERLQSTPALLSIESLDPGSLQFLNVSLLRARNLNREAAPEARAFARACTQAVKFYGSGRLLIAVSEEFTQAGLAAEIQKVPEFAELARACAANSGKAAQRRTLKTAWALWHDTNSVDTAKAAGADREYACYQQLVSGRRPDYGEKEVEAAAQALLPRALADTKSFLDFALANTSDAEQALMKRDNLSRFPPRHLHKRINEEIMMAALRAGMGLSVLSDFDELAFSKALIAGMRNRLH